MSEPSSMSLPSHVQGRTDVPLIEEPIGLFLDRTCQEYGERDALICPAQGLWLSYRELLVQVDAVGRGLLAIGLKKGDRIGIWSANRAEWVLLLLAAGRIGLILVTINPAYREPEALHALRLSGCRAVVAQRAHKGSNYYQMLASLTQGAESARLPQLERVVALDDIPAISPGWMTWAALLAAGTSVSERALREAIEATDAAEPVNIQFTSGTTGAPKGATLSHRNILNNGFFVGETLRFSPEDRLCLCVPLYHCFGLVMGVLGALTHGAAVVLSGEGFDPVAVLDTAEAENCTALYGVPTMFIALLEEQGNKPRHLASLRTGIMAGAPCPEAIMRRVMRELGMTEVTICYGMTETSPVSFQTQIDAPVSLRAETVGTVHPHVEVKVVDSLGRTVSRGETGELLTRGYSVMIGYWGDADRTSEAVDANGWMHTGDLASIDEAGYCRVVGRIKDMLIRGGENIYPREIEELLFQHEAVAEVQVFGVPDERYGEEVCAWIRKKPGANLDADSLRQWCRERMAHYKVPRHVEFVESFPMTVTGKAQKHLMREEMARRLPRGGDRQGR
ncbi:AMP-binding protein [Burkholderiaceae bacterium FT117]|uniref:AMP-binding protein n=1 Tax=Zeimonas sediminis TaxID=2944268 RepID=UPI0023431C9E|nr:AMP-binding protein [Zeimonas sediminis]MCM5570472.1 AMP-binding protein [Zeimonas sediminis]